jgi:hypothetical protein
MWSFYTISSVSCKWCANSNGWNLLGYNGFTVAESSYPLFLFYSEDNFGGCFDLCCDIFGELLSQSLKANIGGHKMDIK